MVDALENIIKNLDLMGTLYSTHEFPLFCFEKVCRTCEYNSIDPAKLKDKDLNELVLTVAEDVLSKCHAVYSKGSTPSIDFPYYGLTNDHLQNLGYIE